MPGGMNGFFESVVVQNRGDSCPFYSPSLSLLGIPEHSLVLEDVSVARDLPFKLSLGGEREILGIGKKWSELLWQTPNCLKI